MLKNINDDDQTSLDYPEQCELFKINICWLKFLQLNESEIINLKQIYKLIDNERQKTTVYPTVDAVHKWSYLCNPYRVKVVILGQDPYYDGRGTGIAFGTVPGCSPPESLKTIFRELARTVDFNPPSTGFLDPWCKEGVLLLNTIFTVAHGQPLSHENVGWQQLSTRIIRTLSDKRENLVFLLWGSSARKLACLIDKNKHLVLESYHPSPRVTLTKYPFIGNNHFIETNNYIAKNGGQPINWNVLNENQ